MAKDFIPNSDADLDTWAGQFQAGITTNMAALGLTQPQVDAVSAALKQWTTDKALRESAEAAFHTAVTHQAKSRTSLEAILRATAKTINGNPAVDNALRSKAHLPPHDEARTAVGAPATKPIGRLEPKAHYTVVVHVADETTPHKAAKPEGVHGCRIYTHVGDPAPADITGYTFLALVTRTPFTDVHNAGDAGKTVYYLLQWESAKGEPGPISDVISTKIPA